VDQLYVAVDPELCPHSEIPLAGPSLSDALRIDPLNVALRLWTVSGDIEAGKRIVFRARQHINLMKVDARATHSPSVLKS
jgi:hypothetical protein